MTITTEVRTVTPDEARAWLSTRHERERNITKARVDQWAQAMANGEWRATSHILIDDGGRLINGQHRFLAQIKADYTATYVFSFGHAVEDHRTIDIGGVRTTADHLKIEDRLAAGCDPQRLAAVMRMVAHYETHGIPQGYGNVTRFSPEYLLGVLDRYPGIYDSTRRFGRKGSRALLSGSQLAALHFLCGTGLPEEADAFIEGIITGSGLEPGDVILTLRERFIADKASSSRGLKEGVKVGLAIRAWNAYIAGESLLRMVWKPGMLAPGRYPRIRGCTIIPKVDQREEQAA